MKSCTNCINLYFTHKPPPQKTYQMFETTHSLKLEWILIQNETFLQSGESKSD